jgi:hypothetical protein
MSPFAEYFTLCPISSNCSPLTSCCPTHFSFAAKRGNGRLVRCYIERIIQDFTTSPCMCPKCSQQFARPAINRNKPVHKIVGDRVFTRRLCTFTDHRHRCWDRALFHSFQVGSTFEAVGHFMVNRLLDVDFSPLPPPPAAPQSPLFAHSPRLN